MFVCFFFFTFSLSFVILAHRPQPLNVREEEKVFLFFPYIQNPGIDQEKVRRHSAHKPYLWPFEEGEMNLYSFNSKGNSGGWNAVIPDGVG